MKKISTWFKSLGGRLAAIEVMFIPLLLRMDMRNGCIFGLLFFDSYASLGRYFLMVQVQKDPLATRYSQIEFKNAWGVWEITFSVLWRWSPKLVLGDPARSWTGRHLTMLQMQMPGHGYVAGDLVVMSPFDEFGNGLMRVISTYPETFICRKATRWERLLWRIRKKWGKA